MVLSNYFAKLDLPLVESETLFRFTAQENILNFCVHHCIPMAIHFFDAHWPHPRQPLLECGWCADANQPAHSNLVYRYFSWILFGLGERT